MSNDARIALEKRIVRGLIKEMAVQGWKPVVVECDGEAEQVNSPDAAIEEIFSVDVSRLVFKWGDNERHSSVLLICGNGEDIISNWSARWTDFDQTMDQFLDHISEYF